MLYSVKQIRQIEQSAAQQLEPGNLMRAAGLAAAQVALKLLTAPSQAFLILAGPGNNGGDAFEVAVHLAKAGQRVHILHHPPKGTRAADAEQALAKARACDGIVWLDSDALLDNNYAMVIDGLFGIGLKPQKFSESMLNQVAHINMLACPILALDVPSGLDADTGMLIGPVAVRATHTVTFIGDKPGLHTGDGRDYAGVVKIERLGIADQLFPAATMQLNHPTLFSAVCQPRRHNSHKGSYGAVKLIGGAAGMQGALVLAARAALYSGAGRVYAGFVDGAPAYDSMQPEIMCRAAQQLSTDSGQISVIGPGLGNSVASFALLSHALLCADPVVLDADALNLLAQQPALMALCNGRDAGNTLLTPHPLEAARLLACTVEQIQADRVGAAKKLARRFSAAVILKGSGSVIAHPDGRVVINGTGNAGLATGGSGDVLSGVCGALIAQHRDIWPAALAATYLHGTAADNLVARGIGPVGLTPGELIVQIRAELNATCHALNTLNNAYQM